VRLEIRWLERWFGRRRKLGIGRDELLLVVLYLATGGRPCKGVKFAQLVRIVKAIDIYLGAGLYGTSVPAHFEYKLLQDIWRLEVYYVYWLGDAIYLTNAGRKRAVEIIEKLDPELVSTIKSFVEARER